jgi:hypothetical protein
MEEGAMRSIRRVLSVFLVHFLGNFEEAKAVKFLSHACGQMPWHAPFNYTNMNDHFVPIFEQVRLLEWNFVDIL